MSTGDGPGAAASLPDDPLPSTLKRLFQKMRRTILVPLHSETLRKQGLRREQTGFPVVTGDLPFAGGSAAFELGPAAEPGRLRFTVAGALPGEPLALLVGSNLNFAAAAEPATARLAFAAPSPSPRRDSKAVGDDASARGALSLSAYDQPGKQRPTHDPLEHLPGARTDRLEWRYNEELDVLEINCAAPAHFPAVAVAIEFRSVEHPDERELHVAILKSRSTAMRLFASVRNLGPAALGREVDVSIEPVRPDNPAHVRALLGEASNEFVSLPVTQQNDGSWSVDFRWEDQQAAAANPRFGWALQLSTSQEVAR